jgi:hypothetical protein
VDNPVVQADDRVPLFNGGTLKAHGAARVENFVLARALKD